MKSTFQVVLNRMRAPLVAAPSAMVLSQQAFTDPGDRSAGAVVAPTRVLTRARKYAWAAGVALVALGLHFYYVRELLVQFALFSLFFLSLSLVVLSIFFVWHAGNRAATWTGVASRAATTFFRRLASQTRS